MENNISKQKARYMILKETEKGTFKNLNEEKFADFDLGLSWDFFVNQVNFLVREGYLTKPFYADDTIYSFTSEITEKGELYLEENSLRSKLYNGAKEIRDWIK